jgi:hypothetical protein
VRGGAPEGPRGKRIVHPDMGAPVAAAKYRGECEDRLEAALREITLIPRAVETPVSRALPAGEVGFRAAVPIRPAPAAGRPGAS